MTTINKRPRAEDDDISNNNFLFNDNVDDLHTANKRQRFNADTSTSPTNSLIPTPTTLDVEAFDLKPVVPHYIKPIKALDQFELMNNNADNDNDDDQYDNEFDQEDNKNVKAKSINTSNMIDREAMFELMMAKQGVFLSNTEKSNEVSDAVDMDNLTAIHNLGFKQQLQILRDNATTSDTTTIKTDPSIDEHTAYQKRIAEFHRQLDQDAATGRFLSHADNSDDDHDGDHEAGEYSCPSSLSRFNKHAQQQPQEEKKVSPEEILASFTTLIQVLKAFEVTVGGEENKVYTLYMKKPTESQLLTVDFVLTKLNALTTSLQAEIAKDIQAPPASNIASMSDEVSTAAPVMIDPRQRAKKNVRSKPAPAVAQKPPAIPYDELRAELTQVKEIISRIINASVILLQLFEAGVGSLTSDELQQCLLRYKSNLIE